MNDISRMCFIGHPSTWNKSTKYGNIVSKEGFGVDIWAVPQENIDYILTVSPFTPMSFHFSDFPSSPDFLRRLDLVLHLEHLFAYRSFYSIYAYLATRMPEVLS